MSLAGSTVIRKLRVATAPLQTRAAARSAATSARLLTSPHLSRPAALLVLRFTLGAPIQDESVNDVSVLGWGWWNSSASPVGACGEAGGASLGGGGCGDVLGGGGCGDVGNDQLLEHLDWSREPGASTGRTALLAGGSLLVPAMLY